MGGRDHVSLALRSFMAIEGHEVLGTDRFEATMERYGLEPFERRFLRAMALMGSDPASAQSELQALSTADGGLVSAYSALLAEALEG